MGRTINSVAFFPLLILAATTHTTNGTNLSAQGKEHILSLALVASPKHSKATPLTIIITYVQWVGSKRTTTS